MSSLVTTSEIMHMKLVVHMYQHIAVNEYLQVQDDLFQCLLLSQWEKTSRGV